MFSRRKASTPARPNGDGVIISAQDVSKTYDTGSNRVQALKSVNFEVKIDPYITVRDGRDL